MRGEAQNLVKRLERGDFPLQVPELRPPSSTYQPDTGTCVKQLRFAKQLKSFVKRLTHVGPVLIPELRQDMVQKREPVLPCLTIHGRLGLANFFNRGSTKDTTLMEPEIASVSRRKGHLRRQSGAFNSGID